MSNPYLDGMIKAASVFPAPGTLARMAKSSPWDAENAARHLQAMHEHSSAIEHLTAQRDAHARDLADVMEHISRNGTSPDSIQAMRHLSEKKSDLDYLLSAHHQGMKWHENRYEGFAGADPKYKNIKNAGPDRSGKAPGADAVNLAWESAKNQRLF